MLLILVISENRKWNIQKVLLLFSVTSEGGAKLSLFSANSCVNPNAPFRILNFDSGPWLNIFLDMKFSCDGIIQDWTFFAKNTGSFYATVWRPSGRHIAKLVGKNKIEVSKLGKQVNITFLIEF